MQPAKEIDLSPEKRFQSNCGLVTEVKNMSSMETLPRKKYIGLWRRVSTITMHRMTILAPKLAIYMVKKRKASRSSV